MPSPVFGFRPPAWTPAAASPHPRTRIHAQPGGGSGVSIDHKLTTHDHKKAAVMALIQVIRPGSGQPPGPAICWMSSQKAQHLVPWATETRREAWIAARKCTGNV